MTTSTCAKREVVCWSTVLPAPNGPGMQYVPPRATGKKVSIVRICVTIVFSGRRRSAKQEIGILTGQRWERRAFVSLPDASARVAISSSTV